MDLEAPKSISDQMEFSIMYGWKLKFHILVDFMVLDCEVYFEVPIVLGRFFLATKKVLVDIERISLNLAQWWWGKIKYLSINKATKRYECCFCD